MEPLGGACAVRKSYCAEALRHLGAVSCVMVLSRTNLVMKWSTDLTAPFVCRGLLGPHGFDGQRVAGSLVLVGGHLDLVALGCLEIR